MVRTYQRDPKSRSYRFYSKEDEQKPVEAIRNGMTYTDAEEIFHVPRRTISNRIHGKHSGSIDHPTVFSLEEEDEFEKVPIDQSDHGIEMILAGVKGYVQAVCKEKGYEIKEFVDNYPGDDWVHGLLDRHASLKERFGKKPPEIDQSKIADYFRHTMRRGGRLVAASNPLVATHIDEIIDSVIKGDL